MKMKENTRMTGLKVWWLALPVVAGVLTGCASSTPAPVISASGVSPVVSSTSIRTAVAAKEHIVRPGEGLYAISRQYGVSVQDLQRWNAGQNLETLRIGQHILVSPPSSWDGQSTLAGAATAGAAGGVMVGGAVAQASPVTVQTLPKLETGVPPAGTTPPAAGAPTTIMPPATEIAKAAPPASEAAAAPAPSGNGTWQWPTSGQVIKSFGNGNKGIDLAGKVGDPVKAAAAGTVAYAGNGLRGLGKLIVIRHNNDFITAYAHNSKLLVKEGDKVQSGQKIAEVGDTDASRPMLHFELRKTGQPVNPEPYLPKR